jgi:uncharacterized OB-fold protein
MKYSRDQHENRLLDRFAVGRATPLPRRRSNCGTVLWPTVHSCPECEHKASAGSSLQVCLRFPDGSP